MKNKLFETKDQMRDSMKNPMKDLSADVPDASAGTKPLSVAMRPDASGAKPVSPASEPRPAPLPNPLGSDANPVRQDSLPQETAHHNQYPVPAGSGAGEARCACCGRWLSPAEFYIRPTGRPDSYCRECRREMRRGRHGRHVAVSSDGVHPRFVRQRVGYPLITDEPDGPSRMRMILHALDEVRRRAAVARERRARREVAAEEGR